MTDFSKLSVEDMDIPPGQAVQHQVVKPDPFDLVSAKARFLEFQRKIDVMADEVERFSVEDDSDASQLTGLLGDASRLIKDLNKLQKKITDPHYKFYKSILSFKNSFTDKIDHIIRSGKRTLSDYSYKKELERREAERKAQEEIARKQAELDRIAEEKGVDKVEIQAPIVEEKKTPIRSESATAASRIDWDFEVVNMDEVDRKYLRCEINKTAVNEAIRSGLREIKGLRIFETSKISIRNT